MMLVKGNITTEVSELHLIAVYCSTEARELQCQRVVIVDGELDGGHGWVDDPYAGVRRERLGLGTGVSASPPQRNTSYRLGSAGLATSSD